MARQINFGGHLIKQFGAYIRTDLSDLTDISGVGSNIIGIMGLSEKGPVNTPVTVTGYVQLVQTFGDGPLVRHALAAYVGGASTVIALRLGDPTSASLDVITIPGGSAADTSGDSDAYGWYALERGSLGNNVAVSVVSNDQGTLDNDDDTFTIRVRYTDEHGNDVRESFIVPKYIPGKVYYTGGAQEYYILRDRYTQTIRDVPTTWMYGNADENAFLDKVQAMKSSSEDLVGPFPFGTGTNVYPLPLVASVINYGGLGYAPSQLVRLNNIDPTVDEVLDPNFVYDPSTSDTFIAHPYVALSGGHNGDDGTNFYGFEEEVELDPVNAPGVFTTVMNWDTTYDVGSSTVLQDAWVPALEAFEDEEVNFIQPAYLFNHKPGSNTNEWARRYGFFTSLMPQFLAHINTMSNIPNRMFRNMVTGVPYYKKGTTVNNTADDFLNTAIIELPGLLNHDRVQAWVGGFRSNAFSPAVEEYGGEMLASFVVGAQASRMVADSLTFARLSGIFTHGLEFQWNSVQRDELYTRGLNFVKKRRNASGAMEYIAAHNYTTFTGSPSTGLHLMLTRRIVDYVSTFVYKNLEETFIGRRSLGAETEAIIASYTTDLLRQLVAEGVIVAYANIAAFAVSQDKTHYDVTYDFQPVSEIQHITVTQRLTYSLA